MYAIRSYYGLTEAVIIDAAASEIVDEGFNRLAEIYGREFLRESRVLSSRRFSAGYGDFNIRITSYNVCYTKLLRLLEADDDRVVIKAPARIWQHVRHVGEDIAAGELIIPSFQRA